MTTIKPFSFALLACWMLAATWAVPASAQDYVIPVKVFLNGQQVPVQYPSSLDVTGACFLGGATEANGTDCDGNTVTDGVLRVEACTGDTLFFTIDPDEYDPDAVVNCWSIGGNSCTNPGHCAEDELNFYTHFPSGNQSITIFLSAPPAGIRDPVSARWNPDAGRRSGGDLAWGPAYLTAKSQVSDVASEAFPALLYSGEAFEKQVDLAVKGRGLDFVFSRVHRSGEPDGGGAYFGGQWTHNFDITATVPSATTLGLPIDVTLGNGQAVTFRFKYNDSNTRFFYAEGWDAELRHEFTSTSPPAPGHFELVFGDGVKWVFPEFELSNDLGSVQRIESIADRFGNAMAFAYDGDKLETITDTLGREYVLGYDGDVIETLTETHGLARVVSYGYDGGKLDTVTYPATTAFPSGTVIGYDYDGGGRLTTVTDPRGNAILTNGYDGGGTLTSQQLGEGAEAGTVTYGYTGLALMGGESHAIRVTDAAGHVTEHFFNERNQLARLHRLDDGDGFTTLTTWAEHTFGGSTVVSDDLPASVTLPDGIVVTYDYAGPGATNADYKFRMNAETITRTGTDGKTLVEELGHNGVGGSVPYWDARFGESFVTCLSLRDGGGTLLNATAYTYSSDDLATLDGIDYYGIDPYAGDPFAACPPTGGESLMMLSGMESFSLESLLESEEMYFSMFQQFEAASELYEFDSFSIGGEWEMMLTSMASEDHHESFGYNAFGQVIERLYPDNDEDGDPGDKVRRKDEFVYDDDADGYLDYVVVDADGEALTTAYTQDAVGRVTHVFDPKNNETIIGYDELDQVLQVQQPELDTATDYRPTTDYAYDENGNLTLSRHRWTDKDGAAISTSGETSASSYLATEYAYDTRNRTTSVGREDGSSVTPGVGLTVSEIQYDGNNNVVKRLSPLAVDTTEPDNVTSYEYDTRNLPVRVVRGNQLVTRLDYDAGGQVVQTIEGYGTAEARLSSTEYDGLGYVKLTTDAAGLTTGYTTDALGRATQVEAKEGGTVLARTDYTYDVLGRLTNINVFHKDQNGSNVGDGWLRTARVYTDAGMLLSEEVEGDATTYSYDTVMRRESITSPSGNSRVYAYDGNGNVVTVTENAYDTEAETVTASFITRYGYDELDRLVSVGSDDGDGSSGDAKTTRYAYDSLGQRVEEEDALGNLTASAYDPLGRLTSTTRDPGGIAAAVGYDYDANDRLVLMTDPNANETAYAYDTFNRMVQTTYADGQVERIAYDALDNVVEHVAPGGLATSTLYDAAGRPTAQTFSQFGGRTNPGESAYRYDALGRMTEARNAGSTVTRAYDTLSHPASESIQVGAHAPTVLERAYDNKGMLDSLNPPGTTNTLSYPRNADGLPTGVKRNNTQLANLDYLGARPNARAMVNGASPVGGTAIGYEGTGLRPNAIAHTDDASATVDTRSFAWDDAYNLDGFQVTGGSLAASAVDLAYDNLNRIDPASIGAGWTLDGAGNRSGGGYSFTGSDEDMHRYTEVASLPRYYDPQGALMAVGVDADSLNFYHYDVNDRLDFYREIAIASSTPFNALNLSDGDWTVINGNWSVNDNGTGGDPSDDYLEETTSASGAILYAPTPLPEDGFTFRYRSAHAPANPDGNGTPGQFSSSDYPAKYYAQALLYVDTSAAPPYPYAALRIEPDRLSIVLYDGTTIQEIDSAQVESAANTWYTIKFWHVSGGPGGGTLSVVRISDTPGDPVAMVVNAPLADAPPASTIGFTVGVLADYDFQLVEYADAPDTSDTFIDWAYDAFGRKVAETVYDNTNTVTSQTLYVWDGWQLVSELDGLESNRVAAEYVPGPGYVDDNVAARRDLNRDGDFSDAGEGLLYYLTDQQHSTVALLDADGDVVERYTYDPFGVPSFYDGTGTPLTDTDSDGIIESAVSNNRLYTGREWLPTLGLYDYRQRIYDPATGRFLTTDPAYDSQNLGNPYTYVGNNPGAFVDPYGAWAWDGDWVQTGLEVFGAGYFTGRGGAAAHSFWIESGGEQLGAMSAGAAVIAQGDLGMAREQMVADTAAHYGQRIATHMATNGGNVNEAIGTATGWQMVGSDLVGFTELDEARTGIDYGTGNALTGQERTQRALMGTSKFAGSVAAIGGTAMRFTPAKSGGVADDLAMAARRAADKIGPGSGGIHGTRIHSAFRDEARALSRLGLEPEVSYLNGKRVQYGTAGSVRVDIVHGPIDAPISVFDLKTGRATLSAKRIKEIQSHLPGGSKVPVFEVRP